MINQPTMKTYKEKAKDYVRNAKGMEHLRHKETVRYADKNEVEWIFEEPTGFDYLRVLDSLDEYVDIDLWGDGRLQCITFDDQYLPHIQLFFNLIGEPLDEENSKKFMELVTK